MAEEEELDDDTYVSIGAAFEQLETDEDVQKAKHRKDKEHYVLDKQGRRRFHGAFTGGFSAGYFNTVGTKQGWSPSPFFSTRGSKAEYGNQRPEDYMDDEDLEVFGIAPREIAANEKFTQGSVTGKRAHFSSESSIIPGGPPLEGLIVPARSTVGVQLLKSMGWREGQGVGPKVMKYPTTNKTGPKVYGCSLPSQQEMEEKEEEEGAVEAAEGFMFAPKDVVPWQFVAKDDFHGIDYRGMKEQEVLMNTGQSHSVYGMSGKAFGVGALEEEDEDIYSRENMMNFTLTEANEADITAEQSFGWTGSLQGDWSLSCFARSSKQATHRKVYAPPTVPRDFVPLHKFIAHSSDSTTAKSSSAPLSSNKRAQLLAGQPEVHSVFDLISAEDRQRLKRASGMVRGGSGEAVSSRVEGIAAEASRRGSTNSGGVSYHAAVEQSSRWDKRPGTSLASAITSGTYQPFIDDPAKQERYEAFLRGHRKFVGREYEHMTEWEKAREMDQFNRAARLLKPLAGALSDKFTRGTVEDDTSTVDMNDAEQAARAGMFGVLTRDMQEWHPHRVLCKRFNIPDPYQNPAVVGLLVNRSSADRKEQPLSFQASSTTPPVLNLTEDVGNRHEEGSDHTTTFTSSDYQKSTESRIDTELEKEEKTEENTEERPPMELFRSIFADSSSDSETEEQPEPPSSTINNTSNSNPPITKQPEWQNLALLTTSSFPPSQQTSSLFLTPTQKEKQSHQSTPQQQGSQHSLQGPARIPLATQPAPNTSDLFGPPLPSPDNTKEDDSNTHSRHKHRDHHSSHHKHHHHHHHHKKHKLKDHHRTKHRH